VAQVTSQLSGTVHDQQGAAIPNAQVTVTNKANGLKYDTTTNDRGFWVLASLPAATYRVSVAMSGFKTAITDEVKLDAGVPATVNTTLEVGALTETVEVSGGAEILQTTSSTVSSTIVGRQINELPYTTRNALELVLFMPGTQTPGTPRTSSINGLPKGSLNVTLDGINIQDNLLKSSDGFFASIQPKTDAVEEVTISTASLGSESAGEGAAQVKYVTRSGSNAFHGGVFWQHRNDYFNSNYYFNSLNQLPRDRILLNQFGGRLGGPILRDRAFFFFNHEEFHLPQTYSVGATLMTDSARQGIFTWRDTATGQPRSVNVYQLAAARNATLASTIRQFPTTPDPRVLADLNEMYQLASKTGTLRDRIATATDYNRYDYTFQTPGSNVRRFPTVRLDARINDKHSLEFVWNWQYYNSNPDGVNGIYPVVPGTGTVLGNAASGGIRRYTWSGVLAHRATLTPRLTSETRAGIGGGGNSLFREEIVPALFQRWSGYAPAFNYNTSPFRASGQSRRHTPVRTITENLNWSRTSHLFNFGGSFTQVNSWQSAQGNQLVPSVSFSMAANDPANTGATSLFTTTNFPNSSTGNRSDAAAMYALLTGRISSIGRSVALDENSKKYAATPSVDRNRQREFALYIQDNWRFRPTLTFNLGLRWDVQLPFTNLNGTYSQVGLAGVWGLSGVGNLFKPGTLTGATPQFTAATDDAYKTYWKSFSPSVGVNWSPKGGRVGPMKWILGENGQAVFRAAYSIATVREGMNLPISILGSNQGRSVSTSVDPSGFPTVFGAPGSVWFRDGSLPARVPPTDPNYPIPVASGNSVNAFDPNLKQGYVQSWTLSFQRELSPAMVLDVRYVGNHGTGLWRQINLNEVNIFENGFLNEFKTAQNNLTVARRTNPNSTQFAGLAGQAPLPIISTALGLNSDTTFATYLERGQAGTFANAIAFNATRMANLTRAGYPANFFVVNPTVLGGGAWLVVNGGHSTYNALQIELKRRMSAGLLVQGSYVWSHSLTNMRASSSVVASQPTTLRGSSYDKAPSPWDIRHGFKANFIYELPVGPGRRFWNTSNPVLSRVLEGWSINGVARIQSGSPDQINGGRGTVNQYENGIVLYNMTQSQLQDLVKIRKTSSVDSAGRVQGIVYWLPQSFIDNTLAAFETGGKTLANLDRNAPYFGPPTTPGQLGYRLFLYGPWQHRWDLSVVKKTKIGEGKDIELRVQFLNAFNASNILLTGAGTVVASTGIGSTFGQTGSAYRDFTVSGSNDPGGRLIEFMLRINF
jgi:hypothetical protein